MVRYLAPEMQGIDLVFFMRLALEEAEFAGQAGEIPIGAVVVIDGETIARGRARHKSLRSQLRHAELNALLDGGEALWLQYKRAILFTTLEPCPLCLGAAVMADVPHIVFGMPDPVVFASCTLEANPYIRRHIRSYYGGVLAEESQAILERYDPAALAYIQNGGKTQ